LIELVGRIEEDDDGASEDGMKGGVRRCRCKIGYSLGTPRRNLNEEAMMADLYHPDVEHLPFEVPMLRFHRMSLTAPAVGRAVGLSEGASSVAHARRWIEAESY
jgi:hypothetical protein